MSCGNNRSNGKAAESEQWHNRRGFTLDWKEGCCHMVSGWQCPLELWSCFRFCRIDISREISTPPRFMYLYGVFDRESRTGGHNWHYWPGRLSLRPAQTGYFPHTFKWIFLYENVWNSIKISLNFVLRCPINNIAALVQIMALRLPCNKPLSEPMMISLVTDACASFGLNDLS